MIRQRSITFHDLVAALETLIARFETLIFSADDCHGSHLQQTSGSSSHVMTRTPDPGMAVFELVSINITKTALSFVVDH